MARVAAIDSFGGPEQLRAAEIDPGPRAAGSVRLRLAHAAVNPVDLTTRAGLTIAAADARFPMVLGWDGAGEVVEADPGSGFEPGDRVAVLSRQLVSQRGTYGEILDAPPHTLARIPAGLDLELAAAAPLAALTAVQALAKLGLRPGETLLVNGALGALGRFALQLAARDGAQVAAVVRPEHSDFARELGATIVIPRGDEPAAALAAAKGGGADAGLDLVGADAARAVFAAVADGGRYATVVPRAVDPGGAFEIERGIEPRTVYVSDEEVGPQLEPLLRAIAAGELRVPIAERFPLAEAGPAHRRLEAGGLLGKVILDV